VTTDTTAETAETAETSELPDEDEHTEPDEGGDEPTVIYTAYFTAAEDLVEHIRAAEVLGLGFLIESYLVAPDDAPETTQVEYEFTLLSELPVRGE
jgi:hypothetical protein